MSGKVMADEESVIGATVVAVHEPSGTSYGTVINVDGRFSLQGMRSGGPYKVTVSYIGYQTAIYTDIQLQLGETYSLNVSADDRFFVSHHFTTHSGSSYLCLEHSCKGKQKHKQE